jgi:hypothetical protein
VFLNEVIVMNACPLPQRLIACHAHTVLVLLANAYMEMVCVDPEAKPVEQHWIIRRTVDYSRITLQ